MSCLPNYHAPSEPPRRPENVYRLLQVPPRKGRRLERADEKAVLRVYLVRFPRPGVHTPRFVCVCVCVFMCVCFVYVYVYVCVAHSGLWCLRCRGER